MLYDSFYTLLDIPHTGKSIALGVSAVILALLDCDVLCICYSTYLSLRDYDAFKSMFKAFGVDDSIQYSTVKDACGELYDRGGNTRELSKMIAWNEKTKGQPSECANEKAQVLLIDEVDVVFKGDFYGELYNSVGSLQHTVIEELLIYIWKNRDSLDQTSLLNSPAAHACVNVFPDDMKPIISKHIKSMLNGAQGVDSHEYIVNNGKICYKEFDGLSANTQYGYLTTFAAMKEHGNGQVKQNALKNHLYLKCGHSSYAEIPLTFDATLGLTGTLNSLGPEERDILSHQYGINKMTYIPSVYGKNKRLFAGNNCRGKSFW